MIHFGGFDRPALLRIQLVQERQKRMAPRGADWILQEGRYAQGVGKGYFRDWRNSDSEYLLTAHQTPNTKTGKSDRRIHWL